MSFLIANVDAIIYETEKKAKTHLSVCSVLINWHKTMLNMNNLHFSFSRSDNLLIYFHLKCKQCCLLATTLVAVGCHLYIDLNYKIKQIFG